MADSNVFNVNITAEKYFEELKLMEQQYGQEEDIYPWIYMLLQMAECKKENDAKEEENSKNYQAVSIRDVHNAKDLSFQATNCNEEYHTIRWELTKRVGPPEMVVLNDENKILGCIEAKILKQKLLESTEDLSIGFINENEFQYALKYFRPIMFNNYSKQDEAYMNEAGIEYKIHNKNFVIENSDVNKLEEDIKKIFKNGSQMLIAERDWKYDTNKLPAGEESNQLAGHLEKFNKVLYTNGLEFYYLTLVNKKEIKIELLGDLTDCFEYYNTLNENDKFPDGITDRFENLIENLSIIDWNSSKELTFNQFDVNDCINCNKCKKGAINKEINNSENEANNNEQKSIVNITANKYFAELNLMEQQYGQEEDLYPWIYMILQMAECEKRNNTENDKKEYKGVSIRDLHEFGWRNRLFYGLAGAPDFAILNKKCKFNSYNNEEILEHICDLYGCVEIKNVDKSLLEASEIEDRIEEIAYKKIKASAHDYQIIGQLLCYGTVVYTNGLKWQLIRWENRNDHLKEIEEILKNFDKGKDKWLSIEKISDFLKDKYKVVKKEDTSDMNGINFFVSVTPIADFGEYTAFQKMQSMPEVWKDEFNNLISNLKEIKWYDNPISKIECDNQGDGK